jgi:5-methylcytosine-specific restriction endonuclease McrA
VCRICLREGKTFAEAEIDKRLPWRHPMAATVDHIIPTSLGGPLLDPLNAQPAHRRCNLRKGQQIQAAAAPLKTSQQW